MCPDFVFVRYLSLMPILLMIYPAMLRVVFVLGSRLSQAHINIFSGESEGIPGSD